MIITEPDAFWKDILDPDEELIWSGRPDHGWRMRRQIWLIAFIAACLVGVSALALFAASNDGNAPTWVFGFFGGLLVLGLGLMPWILYRDRVVRRRTRYALTNRRAIIVETTSPRKVRYYPAVESNRLLLSQYADGLSIVYFKDEHIMVRGGTVASREPLEIGFDFIPDGHDVLQHMRELGFGNATARTGVTRSVRR